MSERLWTIGGIAVGLLILGSCVGDYMSSTEQTRVAVIYDKRFTPERWTVSCSSSGKHTSCHPVHHPPQWAVAYEDEQGRYWVNVGQGLYDAMRPGDPVTVAFFEGGYFGIRYGTAFTLEQKAHGW